MRPDHIHRSNITRKHRIERRVVAIARRPNCGDIDGADLSYLLGAWGTADAAGDLDDSGSVDAIDLAIMLSNWD
ncbi:MAG: hypothetical protein EXS00_07850 [Phycisphaerales bacterium]|nr:hypothetical protein [Phycisphaerales bacterium]